MKKVGIVMGSKSDLAIADSAIEVLQQHSVPFEVHILSAHRCPFEVAKFASEARSSGFSVLIALAGMSAHLAGALAANTTLPVIGVPCRSNGSNGYDALLSTVNMPSGVPVATVAIDGANNAAILAMQILALSDENLSLRLIEDRDLNHQALLKADEEIFKKYSEEK